MKNATGADDWTAFVDGLLRGLGHALSNRVAGLAALADIAAEPVGAEPDVEVRELMAGEAEKLQELNRVVKLLPQDKSPVPEAIMVSDVARDAVAVLALLPAARTVQWDVRVDPAAQPVRVERWALLRALLLIAAAAQAGHAQARARGVLAVAGDDASTRITVSVQAASQGDSSGISERLPDDGGSALGPALSQLIARIGGEITRSEGTTALSLPTLQATRGRERSAAGSGSG